MMDKKKEIKQENKKQKKSYARAVLGFMLGIILTLSTVIGSMAYFLPKLVLKTQKDSISAVSSELVQDTVRTSMGDYLAVNKIKIADSDMDELTNYIANSVSNQTDLTSDEIEVVKRLVRSSITEVNNNLNISIEKTNNAFNENIANTSNTLNGNIKDTKKELKEKISDTKDELAGKVSDTKDKLNQDMKDTNDTLIDNLNNSNAKLKDNISGVQNELTEVTLKGDTKVTENLMAYIDNKIVPGITKSVTMNSEDIVAINKLIADLGKDYTEYCNNNEQNLTDIVNLMDSYRTENTTNIQQSNEKMLEKINLFSAEYNTYTADTDSKIAELNAMLGDYLTISTFNQFKAEYDTYRTATDNAIKAINTDIANLNNNKADKTTVSALDTAKADKTALNTLNTSVNVFKSAYDNYTVDTGKIITSLTTRITTSENDISTNKEDITALTSRIDSLEKKLNGIKPIGSVYMSFGSENPADIFGGKWEKVQDTFLMASGSTYPIGTSGGNNAVMLSARNIPSLSITGNTAAKNGIVSGSAGEHSHTVTTKAKSGINTDSAGKHSHTVSHKLPSAYIGLYMDMNDGTNRFGSIVADLVNSISTDSAGAHTHSLNIPALSGTAGSAGTHTHSLNIPALSVSGSYANNAQGQVNVTNKYVTVNVWKRIA